MRRRDGSSPVAAALRQFRVQESLSQAGLAERLGTTRTNVARWELGTVVPDPAWRRRLERVVGGRYSVADELRRFRALEAITQEEAAERFGCSRRAWQAWEAGEAMAPAMRRRIWRLLAAAERGLECGVPPVARRAGAGAVVERDRVPQAPAPTGADPAGSPALTG
jgi:transcriptional regulator with XRE-family HTH domain